MKVPASYVMYEGTKLIFGDGNGNLDLGWTTHGCCILRSLILDEREQDDTGIGDVWQLNFKPMGLIVSPPGMNIYDYGPICGGIYTKQLLFRYFNIRNRDSRFTYEFTVTFKYSNDT